MSEVLLKALGPAPAHPVDGLFIAAQLAEAITTGQLPVGTRLIQQEIADHYDTSRMPVREALRCVQAMGLINHIPNQTPQVVATAQPKEAALKKSLAEALRLMGLALPYLTDTPDLVQNGADDLARRFVEFRNANQAEGAL